MHRLMFLVIDDEEIIRTALRIKLEHSFPGSSVIEAENGARALAEFTGEETLVITDESMPVMSGSELLARIRDMGSKTPIIVYTSNPTDAHRKYADAIIRKPASFLREILPTINRLLMPQPVATDV